MAISRKSILVWTIVLTLLCLSGFLVGDRYGEQRQQKKAVEVERVLLDRIKALELKLTEIEEANQDLSEVRDSLETVLASLSRELESVKKEYNEKISNVSTYGNSDIEQFFYDRYGSN